MVNMYNGFTDNVLLSIKARCHYSQVALHKISMKDHLKTQHKISKCLFEIFIEISKKVFRVSPKQLLFVEWSNSSLPQEVMSSVYKYDQVNSYRYQLWRNNHHCSFNYKEFADAIQISFFLIYVIFIFMLSLSKGMGM